MIALLPCAPLELSPGSLNVLPCMGGELAKGKEKSMGLPSLRSSLSILVKVFAPTGFSEFSSSCPAVGASSPVLINTPFLFWFRGPLVTPVSKSGDVKGTFLLLFPKLPSLQLSNIKSLPLLGAGLLLSYCLRGTSLSNFLLLFLY